MVKSSIDQHHKAATPASWRPGQSGNPAGRPRGNSIAAAIRRLTDPEAIAGFLIEVALGESYSTSERLRAVEMLMDRAEGKPVQGLAMSVQQAQVASLPHDWDILSEPERVDYLDRLTASGGLLGAGSDS